jgi:Flp pilus assembly pilin Flp
MKKAQVFLKKFWKDEAAQGMVEYVLLLVIVVGLVVAFKSQIKGKIDGMIGTLGGKIDEAAQ